MRPTIGNSIAVLRSTRHHPQIQNLNLYSSKIRLAFFKVVCAALVAAAVIFVAQLNCNAVRASGTYTQLREKDSQDPAVFDPIPKMSRNEFVKRLNLLLDYRRTERWNALYDLISNQFIRGRSRTRFVEDHTKYPGVAGTDRSLITFSPKQVTSDSYVPGGFIVSGCAKLSGLRFPVDAHVLATSENNEWRFSDIAMLVPRDTAYRPCGYRSQSAGNLKPKARP